ncbi:MAG: hypothetical protein NTW87_09905 [Planctomycetota bacterium]|nr:hypothetical protein [Planctomycetota bacterium]
MKAWVVALIAGCVASQGSASDAGARPQGLAPAFERYQVLVQRNMFAKDRGRARDEARAAEQSKDGAPSKPEAETVLVGILQKDGQLVAFLENSKAGTVQAVQKDDPIGRGTIAAITLDSIEYVCGDTSLTVTIGKSLDGGTPTKLGELAKPAGAGASAGAGSADSNSVLERLRKKRQEEMSR